jgi:hypothetical protein
MSERHWLVLRCHACQQCSGHTKQTGRCPHCGQAFSKETRVEKTVNSPEALHHEVSVANMPEELREDMRRRLGTQPQSMSPEEEVSPARLWKALRQATSEDGFLTADSVRSHLHRLGVDATVESVMEQAELEGLVLRAGEGRWVFFE